MCLMSSRNSYEISETIDLNTNADKEQDFNYLSRDVLDTTTF